MPNNQIKATFCHHLCTNVENRNQYSLERGTHVRIKDFKIKKKKKRKGFPGGSGSVSKESPCNAGDTGRLEFGP